MTRARLAAGAAIVALVAGAATLAVRSSGPGEGFDIAFEWARLVRLPQRLQLDARARIQLPATVRAGLDNGVPLEFIVELDVREPGRWWPGGERVDVAWRFRLEYYELTRHYRLGSPDAGTRRNYRSLLHALEALGTLRGLDLASATGRGGGRGEGAVADVRPGQLATLEMRLDTGALPLPLRPLVSSSWRVRSEPLAWRVAPPDEPLASSGTAPRAGAPAGPGGRR